MNIVFSPTAREDQLYFKEHEPKTADRIKLLVKDIMLTPYGGLGKPEPLKHNLSGCWSRRINREHRLVYRIEGSSIHIVSCRYHY